MVRQYAIDFDPDRCVQCHACEVACKVLHHVEFGVKWRRLITVWSDSFPAVKSRGVSFACLHCGKPPCEEACPRGAIRKRPEDGIVTVDKERCFGCHLCLMVCPFGVPQFGSDGRMQKCNLCVELVAEGKEPACVATCPAEALRFGTLQELSEEATWGTAQDIAKKTDKTTGR